MGLHLAIEIHVHPTLAARLQQEEKPIPPPVVGRALVDTGATFTAIDQSVATRLELAPVDTIQSGTAGGQKLCPRYAVRLNFPGGGIPDATFQRAVGVDLTGGGFIALLGRDFLTKFVMVWNGPLGHVILAL